MLNNKAIKALHIAFLVIFFILFINILYINITGKHLVSGADISGYAKEKSIKEIDITAKRGSIYDRNGDVIAKDTYTYTIVAYLNQERYDDINDKPAHVTNPSEYAKKLAPILKTKEKNILDNLSKDPKKYYQTYLGSAGKGLSLSQKEKIEKLGLTGIEFEEVVSRYYPNGTFASSTIGYATYDEKENKTVGKLGVEATYDELLSGKNGKKKYQVDSSGYEKKELYQEHAKDGADVYLTLDNNIQRIVESNMEEMLKTNKAKFALAVVTNAKTNEVLALSNRPTFNPNKLNIKDYTNPFVSLVFEPGSTMKTFTYAAAMDSKVYDGKAKYYSGPVGIKSGGKVVQTIKNYENNNWGTISYDEGFMRSSNTGIVHLFRNYLNTSVYEEYLNKFKFFKKTGIEIAGENNGYKVFDLKQEQYTTGFGQASSITPVQLIQAFSAITNNGTMMKPYITSKIVDSNGEVNKVFKPTEVGKPISKNTSEKMLKLMSKVVENEKGTGYKHYRIDNYKIAGKTGTAEYVKNGKYQTCETCYYTSFLMAAPASDPDIIVYLVTKDDSSPSYAARSKFIKNVSSNTLAYLNSDQDKKASKKKTNSGVYQIESFINKSIDYSTKKLDNSKVDYFVLGNGKTVLNQSPLPYSKISNSQKVFLLTESKYYNMIDLTGFSKSDVLKYASLLNIKVETSGKGYVVSQNIKVGKKLSEKNIIKVKLK
ncbi:penicillin-binding protein 2B [Bacilli bacterium PM5-3]|nr:penicillin-binding protein 2B [Bacilli bacterium PM5-3]MDH6603235.1 penicillin-binding protein 2B [Bacilli bacterium PM5-9]